MSIMNGEIPSVPITTLAGISSLTDLLPELPLPSPLPHTVSNKSLLFHPNIAEQAHALLAAKNDKLVSQLVHALRQTSTDNIELKDNLATDSIEGDVPQLLRSILAQDPYVFQGGPAYDTVNNTGHASTSQNHDHPPSPTGMRYPQENYPQQTFQSVAPGERFQDQFAHFAQQSTATVNGGSPCTFAHQNEAGFKGSHVSSPAQASAAPPAISPPHQDQAGAQRGDEKHKQRKQKSKANEPMVVLEQLSAEDITGTRRPLTEVSKAAPKSVADKGSKDMMPVIPLTRIEDKLLKDKKKHGSDEKDVRYNVVSSSGGERLTLKLSKSRQKEERKGTKRRRSSEEDAIKDLLEAGMDLGESGEGPTMQQLEKMYGEFATSLTERVKRRRRAAGAYLEDGEEGEDCIVLDEEGNLDLSASMETRKTSDVDKAGQPDGQRGQRNISDSSKKEKRNRRMPELTVTLENIMETPTFRRFHDALDAILECTEDIDLNELKGDDDGDSHEAMISRSQLSEVVGEAAKLKSMGVTNQVPTEKLVKVLTILQFNIRDGTRVSLNEDDGKNDEELWREISFDKISSAVDAALTCLYIMTSRNMPKEVFIEDVIEAIVSMSKLQLQNTIFPEFDPVYRVDPHNKSGFQSNIKMKRARASGSKHKSTISLYNKLTDLVATLAELISIQELTDTIILQASTLAVSPFFVENVSELQLNALKLVTGIFSKYEKHRHLILEDILSSLARLPSSKKNFRSYRLNAEEQIQMVTALALQLIQCVVKLPHEDDDDAGLEDGNHKQEQVDKEVIIVTSYETAMRTAHNFLAVFLKKCTSKGEEDYRPLFESFVYDLLATVNKPEWPAAELILSLLGRLLVLQFSNKSVDMSLRVASLDYLGIVAARLRKDAVSSLLNEDVIKEIIGQIHNEHEDTGRKTPQNDKGDQTQELQKALLEYLVYNAQNDPALIFARQFYIAQWFRDSATEADRAAKYKDKKNRDRDSSKKDSKDSRRSSRRSSRRLSSSDEEESEEEEEEKKQDDVTTEIERNKELLEQAEKRKDFLLGQISARVGAFANFKPSPSKLDYDKALLVTRYLASNRPFSQSFDIYLTQILKVLCETAVAVRTKAMKCLTAVVEADPAILARTDMQTGVHARFLDQSTAVREAAIELVGKFILIRPELTEQYYDMLSERILDTGISVRKRVIKIFRDICVEQPEFTKIPEMCVKMIRRVNDEEGIKKLVNETFQTMWFTPLRDKDSSKLLTRVMNITDVVAACRDTGCEWFEQLLENLLKKEETATTQPVMDACTQLVNCLVENVLRLEEKSAVGGANSCSPRLVACFSTLFLFCKVKAELLVPHAYLIQPYLDIKCNTQGDSLVLHNVARILELSVSLMDHPSESFLATLEEDMMKLILRHGMMVLQSCVSCLGAVVNNVSHNYTLVRDCFQKFFGVVSKLMAEHKRDPHSPALVSSRPTLLRSLFTVGLLCRHFDFDSQDFGEKRMSIRDRVFDVLMYFVEHEDEDVKHKALIGLGSFTTRHYEYMMGTELKDLYKELLTCRDIASRMTCQVLRNIKSYLLEEEIAMMKADAAWKKLQSKEDLKEMGDIQSGMASTIIQVYLKHVLESFFHSQSQVRMAALAVITLILQQGLVHPVQCVPYLICMGSDCDPQIRVKADQQLKEIDKKYPGFIQMKAMQGVKMSFRLQELLQQDPCEPIRGVREEESPVALNNYIYSLIRSNRGQRRAMITSMLNMFDDTARTPLKELLYHADNLAHLPYQYQDEPLFAIHQTDIIVSVSGSNLLQSYREIFYADCTQKKMDEDEDDDVDILVARVPDDPTSLQHCYMASQGCVLLLVLKQHLKDLYGFTDNKIQRYSPTEQAKVYDKPVNRRHGVRFNAKQAIDLIREGPLPSEIDDEGKRALVQSYLDFKQLMLSIDPDDDDDEEAKAKQASGAADPAAAGSQPPAAVGDAEVPGSDKAPEQNGHDRLHEASGAPPTTPQTRTPRPPESKSHSARASTSASVSASAYKLSIGNLLPGSKRSRPSTPVSSGHRSRPSSSMAAGGGGGGSSAHKAPHKKKKKRRRRISDSEESDNSGDSDPDFTL